MKSEKVSFTNAQGQTLSARIEWPVDQKPKAFALFANCFTCSKNLHASRHISQGLIQKGLAVMRFDFTGLGDSEGSFADTNFSSNLADLQAACDFMEERYESPQVLVGHSLGGAAVIWAASMLESVRAVATIGAPADPEHVTHLLSEKQEEIEANGEATVLLGGRPFKVKKQFLDDLRDREPKLAVQRLRGKSLLIMHSPQDTTVSVNNARDIYNAAHHPKSFITLDGADHLLNNKPDAEYAGAMIGAWVKRYLDQDEPENWKTDSQVAAQLGAEGYTTEIKVGPHYLLADEPEEVGGLNLGPSPYGLVSAGLAACTVMTMQMYARRKGIPVGDIRVHINHSKEYAEDCEFCEQSNSKIDTFTRDIEIEGDITEEQRKKLLEIAGKCPVHRTLHSLATVRTSLR